MEAALWGRLDTVRYLVREGVDIYARDANGMRAIDLSDEMERNTKERISRSRCFYREASHAGQLRKQVQALLQRSASSSSRSNSTGTAILRPPQRCAFFDRKPDGSLEILRPRESVEPPVGKLEKAFATLDRGPNYPFVNAMSGYTQPGWPNVLANEEWAAKADGLRAFFGLPGNKALAIARRATVTRISSGSPLTHPVGLSLGARSFQARQRQTCPFNSPCNHD
jgi:hypothetical protein